MTSTNRDGSSNDGRWPECSKTIHSFAGASSASNHSRARLALPRASWAPVMT
jgi:hypothetical protein